jgi:SSS family transporter|tara:strand:- start:2195 stop:3763 length:1569 start_codon:yes stop_codon:yes gene_type:complete
VSDNANTLGTAPIVVLVLYLFVMIGIGWIGKVSSKEKSLRDFYLGGSSFGVFVLFLTLFATQYSGNTMLGFAGRSYREGGTYVVSIMFMVLTITMISLYGPRLFRLSRAFGYITPADYIYHRFGSHWLRVICVILLCWGLANYILEQLVAMGHAVEGLSGGRIEFMTGVILLVIVMLIYETLGGMRSVAWTDAIQGLLLVGGCSIILYVILTTDGGLPAATQAIAAQEGQSQKLQVPGWSGIRAWFSTLLLLMFGVSVYPHAIQRFFAARSLKTLRISLAGMAFMPFFTTLLAFVLGFIAISRFTDLSPFESDQVTLLMLLAVINENEFIRWLVIIVFVALVAAIMSTTDSALLSIQSMITKDIYSVYINPKASQRNLLWSGKVFGWVLIAFLVAMTWVSQQTESSIWALIKLKLEFMVQISPVFILGLFWRRLSGVTMLCGILTGTSITLVLWVGAALGYWDTAARSPLGISAGVWGLAVNYSICFVGGLLWPEPGSAKGAMSAGTTSPTGTADSTGTQPS